MSCSASDVGLGVFTPLSLLQVEALSFLEKKHVWWNSFLQKGQAKMSLTNRQTSLLIIELCIFSFGDAKTFSDC